MSARALKNLLAGLLTVVVLLAPWSAWAESTIEQRVDALLARMSLEEKIGQMSQLNSDDGLSAELAQRLRDGQVGSILNEADVNTINAMQRVAVEESRLGIPLLFGRDVIHGFKTVLPIPLGLAATFDPELVRQGARMSALEAASSGINWTFAPMIDVSRDARWGRIAESFGEDTYLTNEMAKAMVLGFQGEDLSAHGNIAATAKHFAGYGASEAGRDYDTTNIPENELRNVYLPPFKAAIDAGVATIMASFSDLNGVPATGSRFLMTDILRDEWRFDGFVVSDYASIEQLRIHGFTATDRDSAFESVTAGVNMEMATSIYREHLPPLLEAGLVDQQQVDRMAADILRIKLRMGLFENPYTDPSDYPEVSNADHLAIARQAALGSLVLLKNDASALPLKRDGLTSIAVIGPMADDGYEQMGTWVFDGDASLSQTPLAALRSLLGADVTVRHVPALAYSRDTSTGQFDDAVRAARESDAVLLFLGEEAILSGEAHSRADLGLPGSQNQLLEALAQTGRPTIAVIMAGRPLVLAPTLEQVDALLYAWHPGSMGGPAIADVLFGKVSPSGKLPVSFPTMSGQVPIYYNRKHGGKPATADTFVHQDDIPVRAPQLSSGMVTSHLDAGYLPQFPFGFGLSYTTFAYSDIAVDRAHLPVGERLTVTATVKNTGAVEAEEVVQLYVRDLVGSVTRPVRELKGFQRVRLKPGTSQRVAFELGPDALAFTGRDMQRVTEPGVFHAWIGGDSRADLQVEFVLTPTQ
jgi:beta-glucosidase